MEVSVPEEKRKAAAARVVAWIKKAEEEKEVRIRDFASIVGVLNSMALAVTQAHLRLRVCSQMIEEAAWKQGWEGKLKLEKKALPGLMWWKEKLKTKVKMPLRVFSPTAHMTTDASGRGWGADVWFGKETKRWQGIWEADMIEKEVSSNKRELRAVREGLEESLKYWGGLRGCDMLIRSDNMTTVANINRRSCTPSLLPEMLRLFDVLDQASVRIRVSYIPGKDNTIADALSRQTDASDYAVKAEIFMELVEQWDLTIGIDLFARAGNTKAGRFYSWRPSPGALGTDALAHSWANEEGTMYAFPPVLLIPKILNKLEEEGGNMLIITPGWGAAAWRGKLEEMTVERIELGELKDFADRGILVPTESGDPPGTWVASLIRK
jgi:ribonuclease HI